MSLLNDPEYIENFDAYPGHANNLLKVLNGVAENDPSFTPISRIGKMISAKINNTEYTDNPVSRIEKLFAVYFGFASIGIIDFNPVSRSEKILYSKIHESTYTESSQSLLEELLSQLGGVEPIPEEKARVGYAVVGTAVI